MSTVLDLSALPSMAELFRRFLAGKHLNRMAEPALWAELEQQEAAYTRLFSGLGYELRIDARGFAWFHNTESNSNVSKTSRQLALLFLVIFEAQANAGRPLQRFGDWLIDRAWLAEVFEQQQDVLTAEGITPEGLADLLGRAVTLGFAAAEPNGWRLLPAVCRYLDHFETLALAASDDGMDGIDTLNDPLRNDDSDRTDEPDDEDER
jgi:hypothetical protein